MRRATACLVILTGLLIWYFDRDVLHFLGWDGQTSDNYAAWSGSVPALIALTGYGSVVASLIHRFNCHQKGCWRPGRHQIGSGVWCSKHQLQARPSVTDSQRLEQIERHLERIAALLAPSPDLRPDLRETPEAPE